MMQKTCFIFGFFSLQLLTLNLKPAFGSFEEKPPSARAAGLGEAMTAVAGDANSLTYNPAGLRFSRHGEFVSSYTRLFALDDLPYQYAAAALPTARWGSVGVAYGQFGPALYKEQDFSFTHSVFISPHAAFGYTLRRSALKVRRYGDTSALGVDVGFLGQLTPKLKGGFAVRNANQPNFGNTPEGPAQDLRAGLALRALPGFLTAFDVVKPVNGELSYRAGEEVQLASLLALRFGLETAPSRYSAGVGFRFKGARLDYAFLTHPFLNEQHHVSLSLWWGPEEEVVVAEAGAKGGRKTAKKAPKKLTDTTQKVNINTAVLQDLLTLPGIGRTTAQAILDYRKEHGPFRQETDLLNVPRFQRRIFIRVRPYVTVGDAGGEPAAEEPPPEEAPPPAPPKTPIVEEENLPPEPGTEEEDMGAAPVPVPVPPVPAIPAPPVPVEPSVPAAPVTVPAVESAPSVPSIPSIPENAVRLNSATIDDLREAGFSTAEAKNILRYRQRHGPFASPDDLGRVPGVSKRALEASRDRLVAD